MKRSQAFPSSYLGKDDVTAPRVVTIDSVVEEMIKGDGKDEKKAVMYFIESDVKPFILNMTNWIAIEELYGEESEDWHGQKIELYVDPKVMYGGKAVGGVRVRQPVVRQETKPASRMALAWHAFVAVNPGKSKEQLAQPWKDLLARLYPGRDAKTLDDNEWEQVQVEIENPIPV